MLAVYTNGGMVNNMGLPGQARILAVMLTVAATAGWAQPSPGTAGKRVVIVPLPGDAAAASADAPALTPPPPPPAPEPLAPSRTIDAVGAPPAMAVPAPTPEPGVAEDTSAMLDGHPREGAFLSGPGSMTFVLHHTLLTGLGALATQMVPRAMLHNTDAFTNEGARVAYLGFGLGGAALGFAGSAAWQFTHWMGERTAGFGIINSAFGAMFLGGMTNLFTTEPYAVSWLTLVGSLVGAWLTPMVAGGDLPMNHGALITTGGLWAGLYTALIAAIIATSGAALDARIGTDVVLLMPAIGAAAMAIATLKFNPSVAQVMRANLFGAGVGGAVLLLSALVLSAHFNHPLPYVLGAVGAIGAQTLVGLLWAEKAETAVPGSRGGLRERTSVWW